MPRQFEINYTYEDCLNLVRPLHLLQDGGRRDRQRDGADLLLHAQALRQPAGNGMHMHMSLSDGKKNLFLDKRTARLELSPLAYQFAAGLLKHGPALARSARRR